MQGHMIFKRKRFIFCIQKNIRIRYTSKIIGPSCGGHGLKQLTGANGSPAMIFEYFMDFRDFVVKINDFSQRFCKRFMK